MSSNQPRLIPDHVPTPHAVRFTVPGKALSGGSKRAYLVGKKVRVVDANKHVGDWKERVAIAARYAMGPGTLMEGPVQLRVDVTFLRPKSHFNSRGALNKKGLENTHHIQVPDITKLIRPIEDALTGIVWRDDSQVVFQIGTKRWGERDEATIYVRQEPGALIED